MIGARKGRRAPARTSSSTDDPTRFVLYEAYVDGVAFEAHKANEPFKRFIEEIVPNLAEWESTGDVPRELHKKAAAAGIMGWSRLSST